MASLMSYRLGIKTTYLESIEYEIVWISLAALFVVLRPFASLGGALLSRVTH